MVKPADLAERADFQIGSLSVSPSRRRVEGPAGEATVEPLIMQVLLLLLDARGKVVTRDELFDQCWGGDIVGDDSLNRAIAKVRRIGEQAAPGLFEIETIPRTGYRLTGEILNSDELKPIASDGQRPSAMSRRVMIGSATAAGIAAAGGAGLWSIRRAEAGRRFNQLVENGERVLLFDDQETGLRYLRAATEMRPDSARAQGLLAYTLLGDNGGFQKPAADLAAAEKAARIALDLDRNEPYARLTDTVLRRATLDVPTNEDRLRQILGSAPNNISVMRHLWGLYQSVGLSRRSSDLIERAITLEPLAPATNYPRAQLLWILGQNAEADRVIERAMGLWPSHRFVRFARFTIYAFTEQPRAALAMLDSDQTRPQSFTPEATDLWRISLAALQQRSPSTIAAARNANVDGAKRNPLLTSQAILVLSALGDADAAFEIANGFFLAGGRKSASAPQRKSTAWRFTPWLFTPPVALLRADPRFAALCDGIGLTDYWTKRRVKPDYQLGIT